MIVPTKPTTPACLSPCLPSKVAAVTLQLAESLDLSVVLDRVARQVADLFDGICQVRFSPAGRPAEARWVIAGPGSAPTVSANAAAAESYAGLLAQLEGRLLSRADQPAAAGAELLLAPLIARGRRLGVIDVVLPARDEADILRDQGLLGEIAAHAALAIDTADQFSRRGPAGNAGATAPGGETAALLALLAHDLRNSITTINSSIQILARTTREARELDRGKIGRMLDMAAAAVAQLAGQIDALTPRPAGGAARAPAQGVDLVRLTRLMAHFYQQTTGRHQITVHADMPELSGPWAQDQIERVLGNLLANAIKYSPAGGEIRVALSHERDTLGSWAALLVQNPGIGIPAPDLPRLAQPGYRGRNVGAIPGTGFGLASVREIVEQHGGTLAIQSEPGGTTAILVRLPLG